MYTDLLLRACLCLSGEPKSEWGGRKEKKKKRQKDVNVLWQLLFEQIIYYNLDFQQHLSEWIKNKFI